MIPIWIIHRIDIYHLWPAVWVDIVNHDSKDDGLQESLFKRERYIYIYTRARPHKEVLLSVYLNAFSLPSSLRAILSFLMAAEVVFVSITSFLV